MVAQDLVPPQLGRHNDAHPCRIPCLANHIACHHRRVSNSSRNRLSADAFDQAKGKAAALAARAGAILGAPITIEEGAEVVPGPACRCPRPP